MTDDHIGDANEMVADLRAALDAAITAARAAIDGLLFVAYYGGEVTNTAADADFDRYTALVELRGRWQQHDAMCPYRDDDQQVYEHVHYHGLCAWWPEIEAAVRHLLGMPVDGPTEAHSARNDDQPSG